MAEQMHWLACGETEPPESESWLNDRDRRRLGGMSYTKRYEEARLSRWTAQRTVALFLDLEDTVAGIGSVAVSNAPDGSPRASAPGTRPISISSTDRAGWAVSVVTDGEAPIGCDLEIVEPRSTAFVRDYFTEREQRTVADAGLPVDLTANLIWSAKESALKVMRTGLRRDTRTVEVNIEFGDADAWAPLVISGAGRFHGWWRRYGDFLLTVAAAETVSPPVSLVEPSPLASAQPAHTWLTHPLRTT